MRIKGIIFDLDGTLIDSLADLANSVNRALVEYGYPANPVDDYRNYVGEGGKNLIRRAMHVDSYKPELEPIVERFKEIYNRDYNKETCVYDGIVELLDWLDENDIEYAVLSNKFHEFTLKTVEAFFPGRRFSAVIGMHEGKPLKPDPAPAYEIMEIFKCEKEEVILIGDTPVDLETAKNAGILSLGVTWGFKDKSVLIENGADAIADTPDEIREIIMSL